MTRSGKARKKTGATLMILGVLMGLAIRFVPDSEMNEVLVVISFLPLFMVLGGAFLFWRGRQYAAQAEAVRIIGDSKPDVLYLRTFRSDPSIAGNVFSSLATPGLMSGLATEEEQLADALRPFGDLIAIGKPGESLPLPGAARMYATDEEWKAVVERHMRDARLVVIRAGVGDNLMWELKRAVTTLSPHKVLILALRMKPKDYESFRALAEPIVKATLPDARTVRRSGRVSGFVAFGPKWAPGFLPLTAPYFRRSVYKPLRRLFKFALRPVYESAGVQWLPPPVSAATVTAFSVLGLFVLLILFAIAASL